MALIKNLLSGDLVLLKNHHVFGRNKYGSNTFIPEEDVSRFHAILFRKCNKWYIRDLSRNGTLINERIISNTTVALSINDTIQFGKNKSTKWVVKDLSNTMGYIKSLTHKNKILTLSSFCSLPDEENPEISLYLNKERKWIAEKAGKTIKLEHKTTFQFNNEKWMFIENENLEDTLDYGYLINQAYFKFNLSANEERISLRIISNELYLDLGERAHNNLLLFLARKRLIDLRQGHVSDEQGWFDIHELADKLTIETGKDIDIYCINLQIHRLRRQLIELEPHGYLFSNIIERRRGEIRFAHPKFKLVKEEQVVGEILGVV